MVNTFVTFLGDYKKTAQSLDTKRLQKQIVEAVTIYNCLNDLIYVAKHYEYGFENSDLLLLSTKNFPLSSDDAKLAAKLFQKQMKFMDMTKKSYQNESTRLIYKSGEYEEISLKKFDSFYGSDGYRKVTLKGYINHPITRMWFLFTDSLFNYIVAMIKEYTSRKSVKGKYFTSKYSEYFKKEKKDVLHPWWTMHPYFITTMKCSLYRKEVERKEKDWYVDKFDGIQNSKFFGHGYIWVSHQSEENLITLLRKKKMDAEDICGPITSDKKPTKRKK
jgi:hypothetical protein